MALKKGDVFPDERVTRHERKLTRVEQLLGQIQAKQREIRLLEIELDRTDHNELAEKTDSKLEE